MVATTDLFVTRLYRARLGRKALSQRLAAAMLAIAREDRAGRAWCAREGYRGYTSYASLNDLPQRAPAFAELEELLDAHVAAFARAVSFDLGGRALSLDSMWINVMRPGGQHTGHLHPLSVVSGVYYVETPAAGGDLKLEDPRLGLMMAAPPRRARAPLSSRSFVYVHPRPGEVFLWESWLRHETGRNESKRERLSVSFNYAWK
jgi:uncharacterized protein (TIGR02466 family)